MALADLALSRSGLDKVGDDRLVPGLLEKLLQDTTTSLLTVRAGRVPVEDRDGSPVLRTVDGAAGAELVSRLGGLAKELDRPLRCSAAFTAALDAPLVSLGRFDLKGVTEPEEVFAPAAPDDCPRDS